MSEIKYPESLWGSISREAKNLVMDMTNRDPSMRPTAVETLEHSWFDEHMGPCADSRPAEGFANELTYIIAHMTLL